MSRRGLVALVVVSVAGGAGASAAPPERSVAELVGRRLVVAMEGTTPSAALLGRIRRGEVAGVLLFGGNVRSPTQLRALTSTLQGAARDGGRPPLLIMADQEGGVVRRLRWAPPRAPARELGRLADDAIREVGRRTGVALARAGITVDLAPVADVPAVRGAFIAAAGRAFSPSPGRVGDAATAFSLGLRDAGIAATLKHFPGLGRAVVSTDAARVTIDATRAQLDRGVVPFATAVRAGAARLVMLSSASYPAYGVGGSAAWSPAILARLRDLGFDGVTITDALEPLARSHGRALDQAALLCARAGVDLLLFAGNEASTDRVYRSLVAAAVAGRLPRAGLDASAGRVEALARELGG